MPDYATLKIAPETRDKLRELRGDSQTYDDLLNVLVNSYERGDGENIRPSEVASRLRTLAKQVDDVTKD